MTSLAFSPGVLIHSVDSLTGWGVCTSSGLIYAATPCCLQPIADGWCEGCGEPWTPPFKTLWDDLDFTNATRIRDLVALWTGLPEARLRVHLGVSIDPVDR